MIKTLAPIVSHALRAGVVVLTIGAGPQISSAQTASGDPFYKGKTINMVIGNAPGAGFDLYGRLLARHIGKYIPGNPSVVAQNLDGAGGFRAASRVAVSAPQDGTYIGAVYPTTMLDPIMGDPRKKVEKLNLAPLGSASKNLAACFFRADAPVKTFAEVFDKEVILGAGTQGSTTRQFASVLKNVLGAKLKISAGYSGSAQIYLAVDRNEVQGLCGASYVGVQAVRANWLSDGFVNVVAQESLHGIPELNEKKVPLMLTFAKTDEQKRILEVFYSQQEFGRPYVVGGAVPTDRIAILRKAFMDAMKDPELLQEAKNSNLEIDPIDGTEVDRLVKLAFESPPELMAKLRQALEYEE